MLDIFFQHASQIIGRSATEPSGMFMIATGTVVAAGLLLVVSNSLGENSGAGFGSALLISAVVILLVPFVYMGLLSESLYDFFVSRQKWLIPLAVSIPACTVGTGLLVKKFQMSLLSGIIAVIPLILMWILLIILLNNFEDALHSGGDKMDSIRGRTEDLKELMGE